MLFRKSKPFVTVVTVASMSTALGGCPNPEVISNPPPPTIDTDVTDTDADDTDVTDTDADETDVVTNPPPADTDT